MTGWDPSATALLGVLPQTARGPRREGIFALWLTVRVPDKTRFLRLWNSQVRPHLAAL